MTIERLFIANRGEIAARIRRTCDRLGIDVIAPATEGPDALDLLDIDAVVGAARAAGADAVHPGFGFLAESAPFAEAVIDAGIRWVGPPPAAIRAMGDKAAARRLARQLGIAVPGGYDDADQSDAALLEAAGAIGVPLLIKPAAGGGGKGMRTVRDLGALPQDLAAARREAVAAFGDDRLVLERRIEGARHVEVQVLFDAAGHGVHLGERDCSLQRRHQKILEETPSPGIDAAQRAGLTEAALRLAAAVGYVSAGTCEFLVDERGEWSFLEMNTRLQVEHPVTELVTGRDLVADQLAIAAGASLSIEQTDVEVDGHAVEVRLYAEDAEDGFLPATGRVERLRWPAGPGIRVDAGIAEGDEVTGRFDPMLAKIVAHGPDRATALARLTEALDATVVLGLVTNLRFLRWVVRQAVVLDGAVRIDTLDRIWPPDDWPDRTAIPDGAWEAAGRALLEASGAAGDPWAGGWRLNAPASVTLESDRARRTVGVEDDAPGPGEVVLDRAGVAHVDLAGRSVAIRLADPPDLDRAVATASGDDGTGRQVVLAPMPGRVVAVHAAPGSTVEVGAPIVTIEAMKMEHAAIAPASGTVSEVLVAVGDQIRRGDVVAIVES